MPKSMVAIVCAIGLFITIIILTKLFWFSVITLACIGCVVSFFKSDFYQKYSKGDN